MVVLQQIMCIKRNSSYPSLIQSCCILLLSSDSLFWRHFAYLSYVYDWNDDFRFPYFAFTSMKVESNVADQINQIQMNKTIFISNPTKLYKYKIFGVSPLPTNNLTSWSYDYDTVKGKRSWRGRGGSRGEGGGRKDRDTFVTCTVFVHMYNI